ncbi:putative bifunctional diguanylate cyclase/phosphodiesterase [Thiohalobacter thiocyanaticus]|uniref:EAL domain-containing protein n=1 Tax=Thiohalobacter thiocyanaticus TaxID=585455 RepID=A0A426QK01_9GAMM|nr:EAL domain-containing protein [Thiohalobacter thiocyanaticus]RRQ22070.1 EAL domain-containing protein [Thiohalobacter thiocyanaticus]
MSRKSTNRFANWFNRFSLRQRYLTVVLAVSVVILASSLVTEYHIRQTQERSTHSIENRNQVQLASRSLRNAVWGAEYALQAFILTPTTWYREAVQMRIRAAMRTTEQLQQLDWPHGQGLDASIREIDSALLELNRTANRLMDIRSDVEQLFPAANLMDDTLSPARTDFITAAQLAMQELKATDKDAFLRDIESRFQSSLRAWLQMIGAFRLYVVRQAGIYSDTEKGLNDAAHDISLYYNEVQSILRELRELEHHPGFPLQASESLQQMETSTGIWHQAFQQFRRMRETGHWRADFPIIKDELQPLFAGIWENLDRIDASVETAAERDVSHWTTLAQNLRTNIMLLSGLVLITFILGYFFFQRTVLTPLSILTRAMNQVAHGQYQERLPAPASRETSNLLSAFHHMQHMIEQRQNELRHQTLHDGLTGLPNRLLLNDRMEQALLISARDRKPFCLLMMDLDRFKEINDTLGHYVGDEVLREVSRRLHELLRRSDTVARLGGDEFAVLLPETGVPEAQTIAGKIARTFDASIWINDQQLLVDTSIGIAAYPDHGSDIDTLVKRADVAMYVAKNNGLTYSVYSSEHDPHSVSRLAMISELRHSIQQNELELHYQPKVAIASGELVGVEALLRWPRWKDVPIEDLIVTAEQTGLIRPLTQWVIQRALEQHQAWARLNIKLPIAINLSTWNLEHADIDATIGELLDRFQVRPEYLELEITENAMLKNPERAQEILHRLSRRGIRLSIDDYGTGFSSLAYLKQMPVRQIKIDRSFVMDMMEDENNAVIVRSTIDLAHNLGLEVVAEGVENADIWDILQILDCDIAQGYHIARPMPADRFVDWLRERAQRLADNTQDTA